MDNLYAYTSTGESYPAFVSVNERDGKYVLMTRSEGSRVVTEVELPLEHLREMGKCIVQALWIK